MMTAIPAPRVVHVWPWIMQTLDKALAQTKGNPFTLLHELTSGVSSAWKLEGDAEGCVIASIAPTQDGKQALWIEYAAGSIPGGPRQKMRAAQDIVDKLTGIARHNNCAEVRIEGRMEWSRLLTGFVLTEINGTKVLRKVL